jgi:hypothetical protein
MPYGKHPGTRSIAMPSVLDIHELDEHIDIYPIPAERPQAHEAASGFWHTLAQYVGHLQAIKLHRTPRCRDFSAPQIETSVELLARQYPSLYLYAM